MTSENAVGMASVREAMARDFREKLSDVMEPAKLDAVVSHLSTAEQSFSITGSILSLVFYLRVQIQMPDGTVFTGNAGGIAAPGGGALIGTVYTNDLARLYRDTTSFVLSETPLYTAIVFFDSDHNTLGSCQASALSTSIAGIVGGTGSWDR